LRTATAIDIDSKVVRHPQLRPTVHHLCSSASSHGKFARQGVDATLEIRESAKADLALNLGCISNHGNHAACPCSRYVRVLGVRVAIDLESEI
jgi:hypothetical protein